MRTYGVGIRKIFCSFLLLLISACSEKEREISPLLDDVFSENCEISEAPDRIQVSATRATETLNILFVLGIQKTWPFQKNQNPVRDSVPDAFKRFRRHRALELTAELVNKSGSISIPAHLSGLLTYDNDFKWRDDPSHFFVDIPDLSDTFADEYLVALNQFYQDANVAAFLSDHIAIYQGATSEAAANLPSIEDVQFAAAYFGAPKAAYCARVSLAFYSMAVSIDGSMDRDDLALMVLGPMTDIWPHEPFFDEASSGYTSKRILRDLTFHEFGHSFFELPDTLISDSEVLFPLIQDTMRENRYGSWDIALDEHIVRAAEIRLWELLGEPNIAEQKRRENAAFSYLATVEDLLIDYENARDTYPTLDAYLPKLVAELVARTEHTPPVR